MRRQALTVLLLLAVMFGLTLLASAQGLQLDENCTATILNRTVQLNHQGGFAIPNVPVVDGKYRVRIVCKAPNGGNTYAVSDYFALVANGTTSVTNLVPADNVPAPVSINIIVPFANPNLTSVGQNVQLNVRATLPADPNFPSTPQYRDVTLAVEGTTYTTSNAKIATVTKDGVVTAVSHGQAVITARNEGAVSTVIFNIQTPIDTDGDGMPDDWEIANGLNPNDPTDAGTDLDADGLTNLQEYKLGTNPRVKDTDGDGLTDGQEVQLGTNPLLPDSDGDGLLDGQELKLKTDPLNPDTDADGMPDGKEVKLGLNPLVPDLTTTIQGRLIGPDGNPVLGGSAVIFSYFSGNTDNTGFFKVPLVPASIGNIVVQGSGLSGDKLLSGNSSPTAPVAGGITDVGTVQLKVDANVVSGRVLNGLNQPVAGANVIVQSGPNLIGRTTTSDAQGNFRVTNQTSGPIVITATDPKTLLRGKASGVLLPPDVQNGGSLNLNVILLPSGKLTGVVYGRDGKTPVGAGIKVDVSGPISDTTKTDGVGRYTFDYVPLGSYQLDASDTNGNRGRSNINIQFTSQTQKADITFLARGNVNVTVVDGASNPVANANVYLYSGSIFGGTQQGTTDSSGVFSFPGVFFGNFTVTARSPISRLAGQTDGKVQSDKQNVAITVMLQASGSIKGTVVRHDGTTKVTGALVQLSNGLTAVTDNNGVYQIDFVPTGSYQVDVTDGNTGDRGRTFASISTQDQIANGDVTMNGLGNVTVTVKDGGDHAVPGAQVNIISQTQFGGGTSGITASDGTITFSNFLAGPYYLYAFNKDTGLAGSANDTVGVNQTQSTTVKLQSAGTIHGYVYGPDGVSKVPYISVRLQGQVNRTANTDADGHFVFTTVPVNTYNLAVVDNYNNLRAFVQGVPLQTDGQSVQQDLTLIGVGTVTGTVRNPDGTPASGIGVTLGSTAPGYAHAISGQTNVSGVYTITQVPVGNFTVSASGVTATATLFGTTDSKVSTDGETVTADIQLTETQVPVSAGISLYDANGFVYDIGQDGSIVNGFRRIFAGNFGTANHGMLLDVISNGTPTRFAGRPFATKSLAGRQFTMSDTGVAGLDIQRKVFVPRDGYFTRYIELLKNSGSQPVTVDLQLTSNIRAGSQNFPDVFLTSSGDSSVDISDPNSADRWVLTDDSVDADPFLSNDSLVVQPLGFVFDGANGTDKAQIASFDNSGGYGLMQYGWKNVTINPGQTVAYMHFVFQQTSRDGSQKSAERLSALAPEALAGETLPDLNTALKDLVTKWASLKSTSDTYLATFSGSNSFTATAAQITTFGTELQNLSTALDSFVTSGSTDVAQITQQANSVETETTTIRNYLQSLGSRGYCADADTTCTTTVAQGAPLLVNQANGLLPAIVLLLDSSTDIVDLARVRNWAPPLNVANPTTALPAINTGAKGRVYASDGATPIPGAPVAVRSTDTIYGRTYVVNSDGNGNYLLNSILRDNGDSVALPFENFSVQATHPLSKVQSLPLTVIPNESSLFGEQDISFTNTGIIAGIVRRANGPVVTTGYVTVNGDGLAAGPANPQIQVDGSYSVNGLPPGSYSMVATIPHPQGTPLYGSSSAMVVAGTLVAGDIYIQPTGAISGTVRRTDNNTVPNLAVNLHGANFVRFTTTNTGGMFTFTDLPVGTYSIDVFDRDSNSADSQTATVSADVTTTKNLTLTFGGSVIGTVKNPDSSPAQSLVVTLIGPGGTLTTTTASDGTYRFDHVTPGIITVSCQDPNNGYRGSNAGSFGLAGQTLTLDINLYTNGTVTGTVFQSDNTTPLANAQVTINAPSPLGSRTITAGADGKFTFLGVPIGSFQLYASNPANGDQGYAANQVSANGETRTVNIRMNGVGSVTVTVKDANDNIVSNAYVELTTSGGQFYQHLTGNTSGGTITFNNVYAGNFSLYARDNLTTLAGNASSSVTANGSQAVTVKLQPAGTVTGVVQITKNNVTTPVANATVQLYYGGGLLRTTTSAADGSFSFGSVPLTSYYTTYSLVGLDSQNRIRARATNITLNSNGDIAVRNLDFIGIGSVTGQVTDPNNANSPANIPIQLRSLNPDIGGYYNTTTDSNGQYSFPGVPIGNFTVTATDSGRGYLGDASGKIDSEGQAVTADIHLQNNAINLPVNLYDVNGFLFDIQQSGKTQYGQNYTLYGDGSSNSGAFGLTLIDQQGNASPFTGSTIGTKEINGQQIDIRQSNVLGLDVTRKIFVPSDGYFVRHIEVLSNPSNSPITVDLQISNGEQCYSGVYANCNVFATSSGDTNIDVTSTDPDRWVVFEPPSMQDPFRTGYRAAVAYVYDGPLAVDHADETAISNPQYYITNFNWKWKSVTVPAGGRVSYMYFAVQHVNGDDAKASADRLNQLPPEALAGLSGDDIATVANYAVPSTGISDVPALPAITGTISGVLYGGDGATPVPNASVQLTSTVKQFGRTRYLSTDGNGAFSLSGNIAQHVAVPVADFMGTGQSPNVANLYTPAATGSFTSGQTSASLNLSFTNAALVKGTVRFADQSPVTLGGTVYISKSNPSVSANIGIASTTGNYLFYAVPSGSYNYQVYANVPQGQVTTALNNVNVVDAQSNTQDIVFPALGSVSGKVLSGAGTGVASAYTQLYNNNLSWAQYSDGSGNFAFSFVPAGTYTLRSYESTNGIYSTYTVTLNPGDNVVQDIQLVSLGTVNVQVFYANGTTPVEGAYIYRVLNGSTQTYYGQTDSTGKLTVTAFPVGIWSMRAYDPQHSGYLYTDVPVNLVNNGDTKSVTITLPPTGVITGTVKFADGTPVGNRTVTLRTTANIGFGPNATTDANGTFTFTDVPAWGIPLTLRVTHPTDGSLYAQFTTSALTSNGQTLNVDLIMPALATLHVYVQHQDQTPFGNVDVYYTDPYHGTNRYGGKTDSATGLLDIPNVAQGAVSVYGVENATGNSLGSVATTIQPADNGKTVNVTLTAPFTGGTVNGKVFAGDGSTPMYRAFVELLDVGENRIDYSYTAADGSFTFTNAMLPSAGFVVRAHTYSDYSIYADATGQVTQDNQTITVNVTVPTTIITGSVKYFDGTSIQYPSVYAYYRDNSGNMQTAYSYNPTTGFYQITGVPAGDFVLLAQDGDSGLFTTYRLNFATASSTIALNVTLPADGSVHGTVNNAFPSGVTGGTYNGCVSITPVNTPVNGYYYQYTNFNQQGAYSFQHIPLGNYTVQASDYYCDIFQNTPGTLNNAGDNNQTDLTIPGTGTVTGTIVQNGAPLTSTYVRAEVYDGQGPEGYFYNSTYTDSSGKFSFTKVPFGTVHLTVDTSPQAYKEQVLTSGNSPLDFQMDVSDLTSFTNFNVSFEGNDGYHYTINCNGYIQDGYPVAGGFSDAFNRVLYSRINGETSACFDSATLEASGRQLVFGQQNIGGLATMRKVFSPQEGGYVRTMDVLTNNTGSDIKATVQQINDLRSRYDTGVQVDPSTTNYTYYVTNNGNFNYYPPSAFVIAGSGAFAGTAPAATVFIPKDDSLDGYTHHKWDITIPAGQTVIFLNYTFAASDATTAVSRATTLAAGADAHQFDNMTDQEKSLVINFKVPHN